MVDRGTSGSGGLASVDEADGAGQLLGIGAAALRAGVSERSLRYYQELELITPTGRTPGGMRRYSEEDLARVARIRELQSLLGLNLEEIAAVLGNEDRIDQIRKVYRDRRTGAAERQRLAREGLDIQENLRSIVVAKRSALDVFLADVDAHIARIKDVLDKGARG